VNGYFWMAAVALVVFGGSLVFSDATEGLLEDVGPDWLSLPVLATVFAAFGLAAGAVAGTGGPNLLAVPVGLAAGAGAGAVATRFIAAAMRMPTDPPVRHTDLAGKVGRVVTPISPARTGEVLVPLGGSTHKLTASAGAHLPLGTEVVVVEVTSPTSVVVTALELDQQELEP
jgi:membrane protein implicated in regulation of membrane protease activity